jgi:hypothetical protein
LPLLREAVRQAFDVRQSMRKRDPEVSSLRAGGFEVLAMMLLAEIAAWSFFAFGVLLFLVQLAGYEVGFRIGRWRAAQREVPGEGVGVLVGGVLGLLAFVLALTLSFANERFNDRRSGTLSEANAIGTAWLRAKAIGHPRGEEIARLLEQYLRQRIAFVQANHAPAAGLEEIIRETNAAQGTIWGHASAIVREQQNPVTASLMVSLNEVFDMTTAERFAFELRLPPQVFWLLLGLTLIGMGVIGYQLGLRGPRVRMLAATLALTWTVVIVVILDLGAARIGALRTSTAAYQWTLDGFQEGLKIPSLPSR